MKKIAYPVITIVFILACIAPIYYYFFIPNNDIAPAFEEGVLNLVVEGEDVTSGSMVKIKDGDILLSFDTVKKHIDSNIYWDDKLRKVTVTTKDKVIRMKTDNLKALINNKPINLKIPVVEENSKIYIPIGFLSEFYGIDIKYIKENNVVIVDRKTSLIKIAELSTPISKNAAVRKGRSIRYPILKSMDVGSVSAQENTLRVYEEYDKWYKVRTTDGILGYIQKEYVVIKKTTINVTPEPLTENEAWKPAKGRINLVWEMMYGKRPELSKIKKMDGLDVVSPTWFQLANSQGALINRADPVYVDWAHKKGYKVWGLLSNDSSDPDMTKKFLNNTDARDNLIREILAYASLYKLDGINIDFENIYKEDKDVLTQFVREITPLLKEQGLVVSIDVTVPDGSDNWSLCYDREALGQVVDYVMLMAYDQHWSTSPTAGSVAQLVWVESNLKKVLKVVPKEKLILGLPFYTRLWKTELRRDGKIKLTSQAITMEAVRKIVEENKADVIWDEESGQYYTEYKKDNVVYKIWMESEASINLKSSLVQKYQLAGAAAWKRGDETPEIWEVLNKNLKEISGYQEWLNLNKDRKYIYK
ncbi:MAG: glycosyl hydrolase family 18 protein [Clostridia bacterium]|nr:glycosyl hydrolase family 18 protein [Clostridia bacterium]